MDTFDLYVNNQGQRVLHHKQSGKLYAYTGKPPVLGLGPDGAASDSGGGGNFFQDVGSFFNNIWTNDQGEASMFQDLFKKAASNISFSNGKLVWGSGGSGGSGIVTGGTATDANGNPIIVIPPNDQDSSGIDKNVLIMAGVGVLLIGGIIWAANQ